MRNNLLLRRNGTPAVVDKPVWADSLQDSVVILDWNGNIIFANRIACKWFDIDPEFLEKQNLFSQVWGDDPGIEDELTRRGAACYEIRLPDGRWVEFNAAVCSSAGEEIIATVGRDITARKKQEEAIHRQNLFHRNSTQNAVINTMRKTLAERDGITYSHAERMIDMVDEMAQHLRLNEHNTAGLKLLAEFHDIGKIGIPDSILGKPGQLTPEEWILMKKHCEIGCRIAQSAIVLHEIGDWILMHHEWWNGQGYPMKLKGEEIPLECRILSIVDAYDAMTSDRPYRNKMSHDDAVAELKKNAGTQFDPELVAVFLELVGAKYFAFDVEGARFSLGQEATF